MKKILALLCFSFLLTVVSFAQVIRTGSFVALSPSVYPISGDVTLVDNAGVMTVVFESNFATVQGATLEVFLTKTNSLNLATDVKISTTPLDQGSATNTPITGMMTFDVPPGINAYEFDNVLVQCTFINMAWGHANLCENNLNLSSASLPSDTYRAEQSIEASTTLDAGAIVNFETANSIELNPGFYAPLSTEFVTLLGTSFGCIIE